MADRCRHERNSWIVASGKGEWCYVCGAYRGLMDGDGGLLPRTSWVRPTGDKDDNPTANLKLSKHAEKSIRQ